MAWYHWILTYTLILSAFAFWVVMDASIWFKLGCVVVGLVSIVLMRYLPPKEDEKFPYGKDYPRLRIAFYTSSVLLTIGLLVILFVTKD